MATRTDKGGIIYDGSDIAKGYVYSQEYNRGYKDIEFTPIQNTPNFLESDNGFLGRAYRKLMYTKEDNAQEALQLGKKLNIPADTILHGGRTAIEKARELASDMDRSESLEAFANSHPEIEGIRYRSESEALDLLQNIESVKSTRGLFDAIQQSVWSMNDQIKRSEAGYQLSRETDPKRIEELTKEVERLDKNIEMYRKADDFFTQSISEGTAQIYQMGVQMLQGTDVALASAATGAALGALGLGAGAVPGTIAMGTKGFYAGYMQEIYKMEYGSKYLELINKKDRNGKRIYSDEEAREYSMSHAAVNTAIEFAATKIGIKAVAAATPKKQLAKMVADVVTGKASTFNKGALVTAKEALKSGLKTGAAELGEEGLQDVNERLQHNFWHKQGDNASYNAMEILTGAGSAMWEAMPAIVGMGMLGGIGGSLKTIKDYRSFAKLSPEERQAVVQAEVNQRANAVVSNLIENAKTNKLAISNPELFEKVVQAQGEKVGLSTVYINAHELVETEQGQTALQELVGKGIVSQEEVTKALENEIPLELGLGSFAQAATELDDTTIQEVKNTAYYTEGGVSLETIRKSTEITKQLRERFAGEYQKRKESVKQDIMETHFAEVTEQEKELLNIVLDDPYRIKEEFTAHYSALDEEYRETYATEFEPLLQGKKQTEKPQWYQDYVAEHHKAPDKKAMRRLALEVNKAQMIETMGEDITPEALVEINNRYAEMEQKLDALETLDKLKDRLYEVADSDVHLRAGLSKEGLEVYNRVKDLLKQGNFSVAHQAKEGALVFASHADTMAKIVRDTGRPDFTAMDYFNQYVEIISDGINVGDKNGLQQAMFDVSRVGITSLGEFKDRVNKEDGDRANKLLYKGKYGVRYSGHQVKHAMKKHNITREEFSDIEDSINILYNASVSNWDKGTYKGKFNGNTIIARVDGRLSSYYIVLEVDGNEIVWFKTALKASVNGINNKIKELAARRLSAPSNGVQGTTSHTNSLSYITISELPQIVKSSNVEKNEELSGLVNKKYYQTAWHGTPHKFEHFDLGEVGSQNGLAYGWGLYFAKERNVANAYKTHGNTEYSYKGKTLNELSQELARQNDYDKVQIIDDFVLEQDIAALDEDNYDEEAWKWFTQSVYPKIEGKGALFEVDIPDNDALLDLDLPLHKQAKPVRKAIYDYYKSRPGEYILPESVDDLAEEDGAAFYKDVAFQMKREKGEDSNEKKEASLLLNKLGIKGITYENSKDGRCYVVFDDKAVKVIERYNQEENRGNIKGLAPSLIRDAEEKLQEDVTAWGKVIDDLETYNDAAQVRVMATPLALQLAGAKPYDMVMGIGKIRKILRDHPEITKTGLKNFIQQLSDSIAIFESGTQKNSIVVMVELTHPTNNANVIIPVKLEADNSRHTYKINVITSAYARYNKKTLTPSIKWYQDRLEGRKEKALYLNTKKITDWYSVTRLQLPLTEYHISDFFDYSIPNEEDLRKLKEKNSGYYQRRGNIRGLMTLLRENKKRIELFDLANLSTFIHESGHVFLEDLQMLAHMDGIPKQVKKDWETVKEWTGYVEGASADENRAAHEKFATAFEAYLRDGKAPTKGLQQAFRRFKEWLVVLYKSVTQLGGNPPQEIKDVMARMLATQEEINSWSAAKELDSFESTGLFKTLDENEQVEMQNWLGDIREGAKERILKARMKELAEEGISAFAKNKEAIQVEIERNLVKAYPIYQERMKYEQFGLAWLAAQTQYKSVEELEAAEVSQGIGKWHDVITKKLEQAREELDTSTITEEEAKEMAEDWLLTSEGQQQLTEAEAKAIKSRTNREISRKWNLLSTLSTIDVNADNLGEELGKLKAKNPELNEAMENVEETDHKTVVEALKQDIKTRIQQMRALSNADIGRAEEMMDRAHDALRKLTVSQAISFREYQRKSVTEARKADIAVAKGKMDEAFFHKQQQIYYQAMARAAYDNEKEVMRMKERLVEQLKRFTRPKQPIRIMPSSRYFYQKIMYELRLSTRSGVEPQNGFVLGDVLRTLDPDAELMGVENMAQLDKWVLDLLSGEKSMPWKKLTLEQFNEITKLLNAVYTQGKQQYEGSTILDEQGKRISFEGAVVGMIESASRRLPPISEDLLQRENKKTWSEKSGNTLAKFALSLIKVETILDRLDDNNPNGVWHRYIYEPINRATRRGKKMLIEATKEFQHIFGIYSSRELFEIRNERLYSVGEVSNLTREQVIMLALNWGTETNRQRVKETVQADEVAIEKAFNDFLDDKDWRFITRTWKLINSYFEERSAVQERMYGSPMNKEKGITFTIKGKTIEGAYFPIVYDPRLDGAASEYEVEDIIRSQLSSNAVWGMGMSATKQRVTFVKNKKLLLNFSVIPRAIDEAVNHIAMRETAVDVNRLLGNRELENYLIRSVGTDTLEVLKKWVRDNWQEEISKQSQLDRVINGLRRNTTLAIMGYRTSTALLNVLNVFPMVREIGVLNTIYALNGFYRPNPVRLKENYDFVINKSIFLKERVTNLDRDLQKGMSVAGNSLDYFYGDSKRKNASYTWHVSRAAKEKINQHAYTFIAATDLMLSMPLWMHVYQANINELLQKGKLSNEQIEEEAISLADRAVRNVFGSGDTKDTAEIQRDKGSKIMLFTPFYSYLNTVFNALAKAGYIALDKKDYGALFNSILYWILLPSISEALLRSLWDDEDDDAESLLKKMLSGTVGNIAGTLPLVRDAVSLTMYTLMGEYVHNKGNESIALSVLPKMVEAFKTGQSEKSDWVDLMRKISQVGNRVVGFSDTLSDGWWTLVKWSLTDIDTTVEDLFYGIVFDKRLKERSK